MSLIAAATRWVAGKAKLANDLPAAEAELARIEASPPQSIDPAEHRAWAEKRDAAIRDIEAIRHALAIATAEAAKAEAAQAEQEAGAEHAAAERQAKADEKLVREIIALSEKLAAKRDELTASIARTEEANAKRGTRPFIVDAETRVRQQQRPGRPAITETRQAWVDSDGKRFADNKRWDEASMKYVVCPERELREVVDVIREEQPSWHEMPTRLADAIKLVDLAGKPL